MLLTLLAVVALVAVYRSWIDAQIRAVVVLSSVLETPVLTPVVGGVTGEPRFEDAFVAGNLALVVKPEGEGPWPALFFVNGAVREGRKLPDPLAALRDRSLDDLGPEARSVVELLTNQEEERFDELYVALPGGVRADLGELSPLAKKGRIDAPVELTSGPRDKYFPISESYALDPTAPDLRVTVTDALDHTELSFSLREIPAFLRMDGFVVRSLRETRRPPG